MSIMHTCRVPGHNKEIMQWELLHDAREYILAAAGGFDAVYMYYMYTCKLE